MANNKIKIRLQGHEKFVLRDGWLSKGLINVEKNPHVFQGKEGPDIFGIGNNMVKSLRYWMKAFGLIVEKQGKGALLTNIGQIIYDNDLYIEDMFTVWILHSNIVKNIEEATSWYMFFNKCDIEDMDKEQIEKILIREIHNYALETKFSEKSVKNDLDVLLNMYTKTIEEDDPEDKRDSLFAKLNLIKNVEGRIFKTSPNRTKISEWNILYELAEYFDTNDDKFISIEKFLNGINGIESIYNISSILSNELLDKLDTAGFIKVDRTAGLDMIYKVKDFTVESVLIEYYEKIGK